jgi:CBS domain-containing protein
MINAKTPISELSTLNVRTVELGTTLSEINVILFEDHIRHLPVLKEKHPVGIISDRDVKVFTSVGNIEAFTAEDVMTPAPYVVDESTPLGEVVNQMLSMEIGSAIVVDKNISVTGIFTTTDALRALKKII